MVLVSPGPAKNKHQVPDHQSTTTIHTTFTSFFFSSPKAAIVIGTADFFETRPICNTYMLSDYDHF